jgi:hypothetical protein
VAPKLVNELVEAADDRQLSTTIARYGRVELLCLGELAQLELDRRGAELIPAESPEPRPACARDWSPQMHGIQATISARRATGHAAADAGRCTERSGLDLADQ